ncbi:MAG: hypothetical protein ACW99Q_27100, partial [Candidatus Kariarchaeaceae archaeon]
TNADLIVNLIQKSGELSPFKFTAATDFVYIWFINNEILIYFLVHRNLGFHKKVTWKYFEELILIQPNHEIVQTK